MRYIFLFTLLSVLIGGGYWFFSHENQVKKDGLVELQKKNENFQAGTTELINGNYTGAIDYFEKSKANLTSTSGLAIVDFNIASAKFELDRNSGASSYIDLSQDERYPKRTRALAMHRAYLMYRRYNDETILRTIAEKTSIPWTNVEDVKYEYMQKSYDLYPLPGSSVFLMRRELSLAETKENAESIRDRYKTSIEQGIDEMRKSSGELVEATSAMLSYTNILGSLYTRFGIGERNDIETRYKDLIQFDQEKNFTTNKQYAFLYYADFLAGLGDPTSALSILQMLGSETLDRALIESLPRSNEYKNLKKIPRENIQNSEIIKIIDGIGSALN